MSRTTPVGQRALMLLDSGGNLLIRQRQHNDLTAHRVAGGCFPPQFTRAMAVYKHGMLPPTSRRKAAGDCAVS